MKTTTLVLAALIISISSGTALANSHHQQNKVVTQHTTIVRQQPNSWQNKGHAAQAQYKNGYTQPRINPAGNRARSARIVRTKQQQQRNRSLATQVQYNNQQRHEQLRASTIIVLRPIPRIALFFPW